MLICRQEKTAVVLPSCDKVQKGIVVHMTIIISNIRKMTISPDSAEARLNTKTIRNLCVTKAGYKRHHYKLAFFLFIAYFLFKMIAFSLTVFHWRLHILVIYVRVKMVILILKS